MNKPTHLFNSTRSLVRSNLIWRLATLGFLGATLWLLRTTHAAAPEEKTVEVAAVRVTRRDLANRVEFGAEFRPYQEVDLHAKVSGYLTWISVDIGDQVKEGQVIAQLEIPELEDDLAEAQALAERNQQEVKRAEAGSRDTHLLSERLASVEKARPNLIPQQELDTANARDEGAQAGVAAAKLAVREAQAKASRLAAMVKYSKITAPFSGVITKRFVDPGALIQAGTSSGSQAGPIVRLSQLNKLRFDLVVSIQYISTIRVGDPVEILFRSGESATVKISRFTHRVDSDTRSMIAEADVDNSDLKITPGSYASAVLHPDHRSQVLTVPLQAVSGETTPSVLRINERNELETRPVKTGLETPSLIEITDGLKEGDLVMVGGRDRVYSGLKVHAKLMVAGEVK